ncbi:hypothetical protein [Ornithinimicrobium kibberense]|uniref:hypothetical protein n=1 Tax=Ornithinimicrobium kibberense TaxID=282060 RepID=UPI00360B6C4E
MRLSMRCSTGTPSSGTVCTSRNWGSSPSSRLIARTLGSAGASISASADSPLTASRTSAASAASRAEPMTDLRWSSTTSSPSPRSAACRRSRMVAATCSASSTLMTAVASSVLMATVSSSVSPEVAATSAVAVLSSASAPSEVAVAPSASGPAVVAGPSVAVAPVASSAEEASEEPSPPVQAESASAEVRATAAVRRGSFITKR